MSGEVQDIIQKAGVLIEALPYIRTFVGKTFVIKYGGSAMNSPELKRSVALDLILLKYVGVNPVVVHGGGPAISQMMNRLGKKAAFVQGLRVTDAETMEIVQMVMIGRINAEIVSLINQYGGKAVGLSGHDGNLILARKRLETLGGAPAAPGPEQAASWVGARAPWASLDPAAQAGEAAAPATEARTAAGEPGTLVDLGFVGAVERVNPQLLQLLSAQGYIPVVAPIGAGFQGESYNINADTAAGEIAAALKADKLIMLTDVEGIRQDPEDPHSLISALQVQRAQRMIREGRIDGGMIPKVEACIRALEGGVQRTHIIDGRITHSLLLEIFTDQGIGTMVVA